MTPRVLSRRARIFLAVAGWVAFAAGSAPADQLPITQPVPGEPCIPGTVTPLSVTSGPVPLYTAPPTQTLPTVPQNAATAATLGFGQLTAGVADESFGASGASLALSGSQAALAEVAPGYVDLAIPVTQFRFRYDAGFGMTRPDRAEYFYAKCGCFRGVPISQGGDPKAAGPPNIESNIDYQEVRPYFEWAASNRFSVFIETPARFLDPTMNANASGFSDMLVGFKYAFIARPDRFVTAQLTTYIPTGDAGQGLGTNHVSIEPGILWYERPSERVILNSEFKNWAPVGGSDFAGDILRYGTSLSVLAYNSRSFRIYPTAELVGWTVLGGKELAVLSPAFTNNSDASIQVQSAAGDTIINAKFGVRFGIGELNPTGLLSGSDLYVGYGRALTGDTWYKDLLRVEYRLRF